MGTTNKWQGEAVAVAQVDTLTPAKPSVGDVYTVTINGNSVTYTVVAADMTTGAGNEASAVGEVCNGLFTALSASVFPEFLEITWADVTTHISATAKTAGKSFSVTLTSSGNGSATNEVQTLDLSGASSGNITLSYDGQTTASILFSSPAATIQTAFELLSNVSAGDMVFTGGPLNTAPVTMTGSGAGMTNTNISQVTVANVDLDAGTPTLVTATEGLAGADTFTDATTTSNGGPNSWNSAANWSLGVVPVDTNDIVFDSGAISVLYDLDQNTVTPDSFTVTKGYTGFIGLPERNVGDSNNSNTPYSEYREKYLKIGNSGDASPFVANIGIGDGTGSGRIKINFGTGQVTANVYGNARTAETGIPAVLIKGTHASNVVNMLKGDIGIAYFAGETATVATLTSGYTKSKNGDVKCICGSGATLTNIDQSGGKLEIETATTTIDMTGGQLTVRGSTTQTSVDILGGTYTHNGTGTITSLVVARGGVFDARGDLQGFTVTNLSLYAGATLYDPTGRITATNGFDLVQCDWADIKAEMPKNKTWTPTTIA